MTESFIGRETERLDGLDKILGRPVFSHDLTVPGALTAGIVRSRRPHARIRSIDAGEALALEGIVAILSADDVPGENRYGAIRKDQRCLAGDRVRYVGEPVLVVVGENEQQVRRAMGLVRITYEDMEVIVDARSAETSPVLIHDSGNMLSHRSVIKGDAEKGLEQADVIVRRTYGTTWVDHAFMETEAGVGYLDEKGRIVILSSTQNVHYKQREICRLLALPEEKVRVVQAATGGGFGGKLDVTVELFLALAVYHTGRPVAIRLTREESFLSHTKRHPLFIEYTTGARKDGSILAVKAAIVGDTGPYISYGETVCLRAAIHATGPYEVPNVHVESRMFYTNNPVSGAMRGFGVPQLAFAHESQMDLVAAALGMDPLEIRKKNALRNGSLTATSQPLTGGVGFLKTLEAVEPLWRLRKRIDGHGFGLGCMFYGCGNTAISNPAHATVELTAEGRVALRTGACEIGQGSDTVLVQILQETIGVPLADIVLVRGDTDSSRDAGSSSASRQTYISGGAVFDAGLKVRRYLEEAGYYKGRALRDIRKPSECQEPLEFQGFFDPPTEPIDDETSQGKPYATYAFATHMTELDVEEATGCCRVRRVWASHDVGKAINPCTVRGQIYGGVAMGIGLALMEEYIPGTTENLDNYYIPTCMDMPDVECVIVEEGEPTGPFGAKGVGEPALIPQAASIVNAISDAVGVRPFELPCHMERLKGLLEERRREGTEHRGIGGTEHRRSGEEGRS